MTSQHFGSLRLTERKRTETGQGRQEQKNSFLRIYPHEVFFSDTSHRHYRFGSKGGILLDCLTFFFPCRGALLQCSNSKSTEDSESPEDST